MSYLVRFSRGPIFGWFGGTLEEFVREKHCSGRKKKRIKPGLKARERGHDSAASHPSINVQLALPPRNISINLAYLYVDRDVSITN